MLRRLGLLLVVFVVGCQSPPVSPPTAAPPAQVPSPAIVPPAAGSGRVEVLNAADAAFARGELPTASGLYERVLNTPTTGEAATTTAAIDAYARFRDMVSLLADGREDDARAQLDALQGADPTAPLARVANQLWDQYGMVGSLHGACAQVQPQLISQAGPTLAVLQGLGVTADLRTVCGAPAAGS